MRPLKFFIGKIKDFFYLLSAITTAGTFNQYTADECSDRPVTKGNPRAKNTAASSIICLPGNLRSRMNTFCNMRHPGEGRGPVLSQLSPKKTLDSGFRRNDDLVVFCS